MNVLAFTGTRRGMTPEQQQAVRGLLRQFYSGWDVVHGDCVGADADFHALALQNGSAVTLRPCTLTAQRAFCQGAAVTFEPEAPIARNHKIVDGGSVLLATPGEDGEVLRSGTWATIRYAQKQKKPVVVVWPNGVFQTFGGP